MSVWQPGFVTLYDGREVKSDSPDWQFECESRKVLAMAFDAKESFFALVLKLRGRAGLDALQLRLKQNEPYFVLNMPDRPTRLDYVNRIPFAEREPLQEKVRDIWRQRKAVA